MATDRERGDLLGRIRQAIAIADVARHYAASLVREARQADIPVSELEEATGLSDRWIKRLAKLGYWPIRGKRA